MDLNAEEIEGLFEKLATNGITLLIQASRQTSGSGTSRWTVVLSGPAISGMDIRLTDRSSFTDCLAGGLRALRAMRSDWDWLDLYLLE